MNIFISKKMKIFQYEFFHMKNSDCEIFPNFQVLV